MDDKKPEMICDLETGVCKPAAGAETVQSGLIDLTAGAAHGQKNEQKNEENGEA
ncbi:hypothetical protein ACFFIY_04595 [Bhargavaea ullalensis]|uniref:Uncharacterized protein n=1 Tax=Bhargavaea ullalensis TaxID=1265685 RepID=A0ABV2G9V8_9BACL